MGASHGIVWSDELIQEKIMEVVNGEKLNHFPTHSEIISFFGNKGLAAKISKRGGTVYWSERLGLPLKDSETTLGNKYESLAITDIYEHTGLVGILMSENYPYDILVDNSVKIDIKAAYKFTNNCNAKAYSFNLEKREPTCDIFILDCLKDEENYDKVLVIPSCRLVGQKQIGVGANSKWDVYSNKWDMINEYSQFYSQYKTN